MRQRGTVGIDLGTETIKAVALGIEGGEKEPRVLGVGAAISRGMRKGVILEPQEAASSIKEALDSLLKSTGIVPPNIYVGLGGLGLSFQKSKGIVAISRADGQVTKEDQKRAIETSETNLTRIQNKEILHRVPISYRIDNEVPTHDAVGLSGIKLEAEVLFITSQLQHVKSVIKALEEAGVETEELVAGPLALAETALAKRDKEVGAMLVDIGSATTSVVLFEEGLPYSLEVLPFGSSNITHDIAMGFRIDLEEAEKIKLNYGFVGETSEATSQPKKSSRHSPKDDLVYGQYSKKELAEIIEARLSDIFELIEKHLKKVERVGLLPAGVFIVGGGANLPGIENFAKEYLKLAAKVVEPDALDGFKEKVKNPAWAGALGIAQWALEMESGSPLLRGRSGSFVKWLRAFLP